MSTIIEELIKKSIFYCEQGASAEMIEKAEDALGLKFADDYKDYLQKFGSESCGGHELTGISEDMELDVVSATEKNFEKNPNVTIPLYVIEETHIDGIVIWQSASGEIYETGYMEAPERIFDSLTEYAATFEDRDAEGEEKEADPDGIGGEDQCDKGITKE